MIVILMIGVFAIVGVWIKWFMGGGMGEAGGGIGLGTVILFLCSVVLILLMIYLIRGAPR